MLVCPMCSKKFGVAEADLVPGAKLGNPDITGAALFKDNSKTLSLVGCRGQAPGP